VFHSLVNASLRGKHMDHNRGQLCVVFVCVCWCVFVCVVCVCVRERACMSAYVLCRLVS